jgi:hypothetical protein
MMKDRWLMADVLNVHCICECAWYGMVYGAEMAVAVGANSGREMRNNHGLMETAKGRHWLLGWEKGDIRSNGE